jgi:hypothetical protein
VLTGLDLENLSAGQTLLSPDVDPFATVKHHSSSTLATYRGTLGGILVYEIEVSVTDEKST